MATVQDEARIQVVVRSRDSMAHIIDVPMPAQVPIGDNIAELIPFLRRELDHQGKDSSWLDDPEAFWTLREPFHTQELDPEKSLQQSKIYDGTRLLLVKRTPGEKFPPLVDDLAEAIAYWLKQSFPAWGYRVSQQVSLAVLAGVSLLLTLLTLRYTAVAQPPMLTRAIMVGAAATIMLMLTILVVIVVRTHKERYTVIVRPLLVIIYTLTATAAMIAIPRPMSFYQVVITSAALLTLSIFLVVVTAANTRIHYAVATASLVVILVGSLNTFYPSPAPILAAQLVIIGCAVMIQANRVAIPLGKISLPFVPATGESFVTGLDRPGDLDAGDLPGEGELNEGIFNQKQQVLACNDATIGLLVGALTVMSAASFAIGYTLTNKHWLLFALVTVIAVTTIYRGKSYDGARLQGIVLVGATTFYAAFGAGLMLSPHYSDNLAQAIAALTALAAASVFATIWSVQERRLVSPITTRILEIIERLLYLAPWPLLIIAMDLFQKAQSR